MHSNFSYTALILCALDETLFNQEDMFCSSFSYQLSQNLSIGSVHYNSLIGNGSKMYSYLISFILAKVLK